jgi:hypothetical protein
MDVLFKIAGAFPLTEIRPTAQSSLGLASRSVREELWLQHLNTNRLKMWLRLTQHIFSPLDVLLTVHHSTSTYWNKRDALFIKFIENQELLHVSSINCSPSGGDTQATPGMLRAYNVNWLCRDCSFLTLYARNIPSAVCAGSPEDEQVMLETCRGSWFSINWMKSASRWFRYTDPLPTPPYIYLSISPCFVTFPTTVPIIVSHIKKIS